MHSHVQIDQSIFASYRMHAINYNFVLLGFLCVRDTGHRDNKITVHMKPVYTVVVLPKMCDEFLIGWLSSVYGLYLQVLELPFRVTVTLGQYFPNGVY